jgi:helix-turn-helix protein
MPYEVKISTHFATIMNKFRSILVLSQEDIIAIFLYDVQKNNPTKNKKTKKRKKVNTIRHNFVNKKNYSLYFVYNNS